MSSPDERLPEVPLYSPGQSLPPSPPATAVTPRLSGTTPSYTSAAPSLAGGGGAVSAAAMTAGFPSVAPIGPEDTPMWWMLGIPQVGDTLRSWLSGPYSTNPGVFAAQLEKTVWWRQTSDSSRQWQQLIRSDPMTAEQRLQQMDEQIQTLAGQMVGPNKLVGEASRHLAWDAINFGWSSDILKDKIADTLSAVINWRDPQFGGQVSATGAQFNTLAHQYAVPISDQYMNEWVKDAVHGVADENSFRAYLIQSAKSLYPQLSAGLDQGQTVRQIFDPYAQLAAKELEISPDQVDFTDPKWNKAIANIDPKTGAKVPMTLAQWQTELRSNPTYGWDTTNGARTQASDLAMKLGQTFGAVGA